MRRRRRWDLCCFLGLSSSSFWIDNVAEVLDPRWLDIFRSFRYGHLDPYRRRWLGWTNWQWLSLLNRRIEYISRWTNCLVGLGIGELFGRDDG
jgi:hypothetical protein